MPQQPEVWLRGPVPGVPPLLQPVAHLLLQAREEVAEYAGSTAGGAWWRRPGATASAGEHLIHAIGALDRLLTYARSESLNDEQKTAAKGEWQPLPSVDGAALSARFDAAVERALTQVRGTLESSLTDHRGIGRAALPSTVIGLLVHAAEHTSRHVGQAIATIKAGEGR